MVFLLALYVVSIRGSIGVLRGMEGQLYEDLLYDYNRIPRPVRNSTDILIVDVGASLIRIIDVDEKNQIFTTNLWLEMQWTDAKLSWNPEKYGGIKTLHIPSDLIWVPDFVLYNNAAGDPDITISTDALVSYDGRVFWKPPAIYKSFCPIDVTWFPYDSQHCEMKFGTWSYTGYYVDLKQLPKERVENGTDKHGQNVEIMQIGMDLSFFYQSAEWDLLSLSSARHSVLYTSCCGPEKYVDITYYFVLRRKTLFYTFNLIVPCFLISALTTMVFYVSDHKITFSISILVTLTVFFLVLIDIIPPTSLVIPMFGRYLMTTMILVSLSTVISVVTINFRFRNGPERHMPCWIRNLFLVFLPKVLMMSRPKAKPKRQKVEGLIDATLLIEERHSTHSPIFSRQSNKINMEKDASLTSYIFKNSPSTSTSRAFFGPLSYTKTMNCLYTKGSKITEKEEISLKRSQSQKEISNASRDVHHVLFLKILQEVQFIADHFHNDDEEAEISNEWIFVAMVLDRLFLIVFSILNIGTFLIILEAPSLHDTRQPMNISVARNPLGQPSWPSKEGYF